MRRHRTGAQWLLDSYAGMEGRGTRAERLAALVASTAQHQEEGEPVHQWPPARLEDAGGWHLHYQVVGQFMTTDLFTVDEEEVVDLVASLMHWRKIRHVPVEDPQHRLVGLVTYRDVLRMVARGLAGERDRPIPVRDIMVRNVIAVGPDTPTLEAIELMRRHQIGCLPVVENDRLVGIVTERDFMRIAGNLLEEALRRESRGGGPLP